METSQIKIEPSWKQHLTAEFGQPYMQDLRKFLKEQMDKKRIIYPKPSNFFKAFDETPFDDVKVVILGQDPYHGPGQAHGLSFSVPKGVDVPPSLKNIYKEIEQDLKVKMPNHGYLEGWAKQGVLLLNATLSVEGGKAGSHQKRGWEQFTDGAIRALNDQREHLVFMLWGSYAQKKGEFIDRKKHLVLTAPHPSPLSAHRGFLGCHHFSKANQYLEAQGIKPIDWAAL